MDVQALRRQIPVTQRITYLNTGWSGPLPLPVVEAIKSQLQVELEQGPATPATISRAKEVEAQARQLVADLLHARSEEVILTQNTTAGLNLAVGGLTWRPGDGVVTCSLEHPSVLGLCHGLQRRYNVRLTVVPLHPQDDTATILTRFNDAVTWGARLVALSHVHYSCGLRMPVEELVALAHERGAQVLLDGAQTMGQLALDLHALGCDYYAVPGQKWLLGPDGIGALYVRGDLIAQLHPIGGSYRSVASWGADGSVVPRVAELEKLLTGTSSAALASGLGAAVRFLTQVGLPQVEGRSRALGLRLKDRLAELPGVTLTCPLDPDRSAGLVTCAMEGQEPAQVVERLWQEHRIAARAVQHPGAVRFCTAFFNTEEEVDQAAEAVRRIAQGP